MQPRHAHAKRCMAPGRGLCVGVRSPVRLTPQSVRRCPLAFAVFARVSELPGCDGGNLRFVAGHKHCNEIVATDGAEAVGYLLGGTGVNGGGCNEFGFALVDTTGGREVVAKFLLATDKAGGVDVFEAAVACFEQKGVANCLEFGEVWRNTTLE